MAAVAQIFDRTDIIEAIRSAWLGARGESGVLVCSHKSGKSFLLDHIYTNLGTPDLVFVWMNLDVMRAEQSAQARPLDEVFLRHFLRRLDSELRPLRADCADEQRTVQSQLTDLIARRDQLSNGVVDVERSANLATNIKALNRRKAELAALESAADGVASALAQKSISNKDFASVVERLRYGQKRVVLLIDDYHQIVKERILGDAIFQLLRGASREGTIITVASSPMHLMDGTLHNGDENRIALFNHFRAQVLRPFRAEQADQFLDWLSDGPALSAQEKQYLYELCGGSPYFLRNARDTFVQQGRPAAGPARASLERDISRNLEAALRSIFSRCSVERRMLLKQVARAKQPVQQSRDLQNLVDDGYLVEDPATVSGHRISSRLLAEFILQQPDEDELLDVVASAHLSYSVFPTALSYAVPDSPAITFQLRNPTSSRVRIGVQAELVNISTNRYFEVELRPSEMKEVPMVLLPREADIRNLVNPGHAQLRYSAKIVDGPAAAGRSLLSLDDILHVMPVDYFTFAYVHPTRRVLIDSTWLIASWINNSDDAVESIRAAARGLNGGDSGGYPESGDPEQVRRLVGALYDALKAHGLNYDSSSLVYHKRDNDFAQRVRRPKPLLQAKGANCLEGCMLFACLLHASDLHPIILFLPGHAIVGWKDRDSNAAQWHFLETTTIRTDTFEAACEKGQLKYEQVKDLCDAWIARQPCAEISDPSRFAIPVDIHAVLNDKMPGILPAPGH